MSEPKGLNAIDLEDDPAVHFVSLGRNRTVVNLGWISTRYANGESMGKLADEFETTAVTLRKRLEEYGLLVKPEERNTPLNQAVRQLPPEEIVERYEGGEAVKRIASDLRRRGLPATEAAVERVLDEHQVIRHAGPGEIPRSAPQGFSVSSVAELSHEVIFAKYRWTSPRRRPADEQGKPPEYVLRKDTVKRLAKRHAAGKGEPIPALAKRARVSEAVLRKAFQTYGYTASNHAEWRQRELEKRAGEIVRMYRDNEASVDAVVMHLRETYELFVSMDRVRTLLRREGVTIQPPLSVARKEAPARRAPARRLPSDSRMLAICGREKELADRILTGGETIRAVADELELDHNWLGSALKRSGHLPNVSLTRLRKWMRQQA